MLVIQPPWLSKKDFNGSTSEFYSSFIVARSKNNTEREKKASSHVKREVKEQIS